MQEGLRTWKNGKECAESKFHDLAVETRKKDECKLNGQTRCQTFFPGERPKLLQRDSRLKKYKTAELTAVLSALYNCGICNAQ